MRGWGESGLGRFKTFLLERIGKRKKKFYKNLMKFAKKFYNRQCLKTFCVVVYARDKQGGLFVSGNPKQNPEKTSQEPTLQLTLTYHQRRRKKK